MTDDGENVSVDLGRVRMRSLIFEIGNSLSPPLKLGLNRKFNLEVCNHIPCLYSNNLDRQRDRKTDIYRHVLEQLKNIAQTEI